MKRLEDQLTEETDYPHLAKFLRSGGTLEVGDSYQGFTRLRKHNQTYIVDSKYCDFAAILKQMDSVAKRHLEEE